MISSNLRSFEIMSTKIEYLTRLILGVSADKKIHPGWARDGPPIPPSLPHNGMYG